MIVTPLERLRYEVTSRSGSPPYLVDIGSNRREGVCLGKCPCKDFECNLFPAFRALPDAVADDKFRCAHIKAARQFHFDEILDFEVTAIRNQFDDYPEEED